MNKEINLELKRSWDLIVVVLMSLVLALLIYLVPGNPARFIIGIPFILLFPGYAFTVAIFPEKTSLGTIERLALSIGISVALVPLISFGLNYTSFGIKIEPIIWSLTALNTYLCVLGIWQRHVSAQPFLPFSLRAISSSAKRMLQGKGKREKAINLVLVLTVLSFIIALVYVAAVPRDGEHFTEFYVLGPEGQSTDYPHDLTVNQSSSVYLGIVNHEYRQVNYTIEVWLANETFVENKTFVNQLYYVDHFSTTIGYVPVNKDANWTQEWQQPYTFSVPMSGSYKIWFILEIDGTPFEGVKYQNYAATQTESLFLNMVDSKDYYSLNINLNITL